jgi:iron complex outermembrane receptor protein
LPAANLSTVLFLTIKKLLMSKILCSVRILLALLVVFIIVPASVFAQQHVTGSVTSAKTQLPLEGISVTIKGTSRGTFTTTDGKFSIEAKK